MKPFSIEIVVFDTAGASAAERAPTLALALDGLRQIAALAPRSKMIAATTGAKPTTAGFSAG